MSKLFKDDVKAMNDGQLYEALSVIEEEIKAREEGDFTELLQEWLRSSSDAGQRFEIASGGGVIKVTFGTDHWDNGWFYDPRNGQVTLLDNSIMHIDFSRTVIADALGELSTIGRREDHLGSYSWVTANLVSGEVIHGGND